MILHADKIHAGLEIDMGCYPTSVSWQSARRSFGQLAVWGEDPMEFVATPCHLRGMKTLLFVVMLLSLFAGSGFCLGGLIGGVIGLILLICLILHLTSGSRMQNKSPDVALSREATSGRRADGSAG